MPGINPNEYVCVKKADIAALMNQADDLTTENEEAGRTISELQHQLGTMRKMIQAVIS